MPEYTYQNYKTYVEKTDAAQFPSVLLIHGEEYLYKAVLNRIIGHLLPESSRDFSYFPFDGDNAQISAALSQLNTYSLMPEKKVVAILDSRIFYAKLSPKSILDKAREAFEKEEIKKAAKFFVNFLASKGVGFEDLEGAEALGRLGIDSDEASQWTSKLLAYCKEKRLAIPEIRDHTDLLQEALEKGIPRDHHLVITADLADKRRKLYRLIKDSGLVIDCAVPKGERRADKMAQEAVLKEKMSEILAGSGKTMENRAFQAVCERTGFDMRTFSQNLEKLIQYAGERKRITEADVRSLLKRTKEDPIYEFTNAVADRNLEASLFYLNSLLSQEMHPLQILAAITNQVRKLLLACDFVSKQGGGWAAGLTYDRFKRDGIKTLQAFEEQMLARIGSWDKQASEEQKTKRGKKSANSKIKSDIALVKNPNNPYPVFQLILKSQKFTGAKLIRIIEKLNRADLDLKTSAQNPKLILEAVLLFICRQQGQAA